MRKIIKKISSEANRKKQRNLRKNKKWGEVNIKFKLIYLKQK